MSIEKPPSKLAFRADRRLPTPTVSVVVPARDEADDISAAIESVVAQTFDPAAMEVIIAVDGRTSDGTEEAARAALQGRGLARWEVFRCAGGSTPANLNAALGRANGDYVCRVDARSRIPTHYVEQCVTALQQRPDLAVVGGRQEARARGRGVVEQSIARSLNNSLGMGLSRYRRTDRSGPADTVYLGFFRRSQLVEEEGWNEDFPTNQDFELNRRLGANGLIWVLGDQAVEYLPRRTLGELFAQYHRFGRWKVRYWRRTGDPPRPRQIVILALPVLALGAAPWVLRWVFSSRLGRIGIGPCLALAGWAYDRSCPADGSPPGPRLLAPIASALVASGWLTGVVREIVSGGDDG